MFLLNTKKKFVTGCVTGLNLAEMGFAKIPVPMIKTTLAKMIKSGVF